MQRLPPAKTPADLPPVEEEVEADGAQPSAAKRIKTAEDELARQFALAPVAMINGSISRHLEMVEIRPKLHVLRELLTAHPYGE